MTTETTTELVVETATQPTIQVPMEAKPDVPGTIPSSYAGYPGVHYMDPVTKKQKQAVPHRFIETLGYVGQSTIHGLGCFSKTNIVSGQFIEECSAILLDTTTKSNKDYVMTRYLFTWPCDQNDPICNENGPTFFVPTGNAMIYNHSDNPNSYWIYDKAMKRLFLSSLRPITEGEEITWYYGHGYAERLRNDPTGENQSGKQNTEHKGCSSCEERHRLFLEQQKQKQQEETENKPPESNTVMHMHQPKVNRSKIFTHVAKNNNEETQNTPVSENSTVEFRSMVVPENKINDTIQDGSV